MNDLPHTLRDDLENWRDTCVDLTSDQCDRCGKHRELYHNEVTGKAVCGACDNIIEAMVEVAKSQMLGGAARRAQKLADGDSAWAELDSLPSVVTQNRERLAAINATLLELRMIWAHASNRMEQLEREREMIRARMDDAL